MALSPNPETRPGDRGSGRRRGWWVAGLCLALAVAFVAMGVYQPDRVSEEARVRESICRLLTLNTTEGRQALVSSVWWAPLPTLAAWLVRAIPGMGGERMLASLALGASAGILLIAYLFRLFGLWQLRRVRWLLPVVILLHPFFQTAAVDGSSVLPGACLAVVVACNLVRWCETLRLRALVYVGLGAALLLGTRFEMAPWLAVGLVLMGVDLRFRESAPARREAVVILVLLPVLYLSLLWLLMNWLIMGDGWYCLRSILPGVVPDAGRMGQATLSMGGTWLLAAGPALLLVTGVIQRNRTGAWLAVLGLVPFGLMVFLGARGLAWLLPGLSMTALLLSALVSAYLLRSTGAAWGGRVGALLWLAGALVTAKSPATVFTQMSAKGATLATIRQSVEQHATRDTRFAKVFVTGYRGLQMASTDRVNGVLVPSFDFTVEESAKAYPGQVLYVLVPRPVGIDRYESLFWRHARIHAQGAPGMIFDSDWGDWRLFRLVGVEPPLPVP